MKSLIVYTKHSHLKSVNQILAENKVEGITYFEVHGQGKLDREPKERIVQGYRTGEKFIPDFETRVRIESIVSDPVCNNIINALKNEGTIKGKIFVYDISESYDL